MKSQDLSFNVLKVTVGTESVTHACTHQPTHAPMDARKQYAPSTFQSLGHNQSHLKNNNNYL